MLNWIVVWVGRSCSASAGRSRTTPQSSVPMSNDMVEGAKLHVLWGDPLLQGLHTAIFFAIAALVVYWAVLNRTTLGYGVKAVGFNPEAARYGGISVRRNYFLAMAISGAFAGIAGAIDVLGWQFRLATGDIARRASVSGSSASRSRCSAGTPPWESSCRRCSSARSSPGRRPGTSTPTSSSPSSRSTSTLLIQGLVVLFVGARLRRPVVAPARMRGRRVAATDERRAAAVAARNAPGLRRSPGSASPSASWRPRGAAAALVALVGPEPACSR